MDSFAKVLKATEVVITEAKMIAQLAVIPRRPTTFKLLHVLQMNAGEQSSVGSKEEVRMREEVKEDLFHLL